MKKKTIEDAKKLGKHRGFECLSTEYKGNKEKLLWRCLECKYKWKANYNNIWNKKSKGCPNCNNKVKLKIGDMHKAAKDRGLIFLSPKYTNSSEKHDWECAQGHRFEATPSSIIYKKISDSRTYCSECSGNKPRPLEELLKFINEKGGELLSKKVKYENGKSIIRIKCHCGYKWSPKAHSIFSGKWCPECGDSLKKPFNQIQFEAKKRGGKCLSKPSEYVNNKSILRFKCACSRIFKNNWNNIQQGKWCNKCSASREERICRDAFEQIFDVHFTSYWPDWLRNNRGYIMQLDGFNEELKIAFEYQGRQHYKFVEKYHGNEEELLMRKKDDKLKKEICQNKGIRLFIIKYFKLRKIEDAFDYVKMEIINQCRDLKINHEKYLKFKEFNPFRFHQTPLDLYKLRELNEIATSRAGTLLDNEYKGVMHKYRFKCLICGHEWEASANQIKNEKTWCRDCGYKIVSKKLKIFRKEKSHKTNTTSTNKLKTN